MKLTKIKSLFLLIILLCGCSKKSPIYDPYAFAPKNINSKWAPLNKSYTVTSKFCSPLFPKEYENESLNLSELVDIALINNPGTKQSWAEARAASALYAQTLSSYMPELNADASYTREKQTSLNSSFPYIDNSKKHESYFSTIVEPEATLSYLIYDFGKRKSASQSAKQSLFYADWMHNRQLQDVMQTVMNSYYDYQYQKQALLAFKADLENAEVSLDAANQKFISGLAAVGDITQAKTKYLQTKMDLISQQNKVETSYADLLNNLGVHSNKKLSIEDLPDNAEIDFVLENLDYLIQQSQTMRQDFLAAQANFKSSMEQVNYAKSLYKPNLNSYFELGKNFYDHNIHEDYHFSAQVTLSVPLFKGFYYRNGIKNAQAKLLKAQALLEQTELEITKEVTVSYNNIVSAADTLTCSKDYLEEAVKRFDIALANYKAGTNTILDVIAAQSSLADARAKNAEAKKNWYSSVATLAYATGSLCMPEKNSLQGDNNED